MSLLLAPFRARPPGEPAYRNNAAPAPDGAGEYRFALERKRSGISENREGNPSLPIPNPVSTVELWRGPRVIEGRRCALQSRRLGQVDPKPVAAALIAPGHFRRGVAELLLHEAFVDLGGGGEAGAQRMAGEFPLSLALGQLAAHTRRQGGLFHEAGDVLVRE